MNITYRIIDANINRVSEGLRVLEDLARFQYGEVSITEEIKMMRHVIRKSANDFYAQFLFNRDSVNDIGLEISQKSMLDNKTNINELVMGNFKRVQEGLRVIEENFKIAGFYNTSKIYEQCRYASYMLEKSYCSMRGDLGTVLAAGDLGTVLAASPREPSPNHFKRKSLRNTDLYCLTAEEYSNGRSNIEVVKTLLDSGIKIIQYREKNKGMIDKYRECEKIRQLTKTYDADFLINDDVDIAILVKADGVHIGQHDLPIEKVRGLIGDEMMIGVSTHSITQAADAVKRGADYIGVGPIYKTFTKKDVCEPVGLKYLEYAVKNVEIPFVAIGGIKEHNLSDVVKRGAKCVAMVTEIVGAENITQKITDIRKLLLSINN